LERRNRLLAIAERAGVPVVEDDPYGQLRFEGEHLPSLVVLDGLNRRKGAATHTHGPYQGNVIYLSTFSKILAPGLRLAWVVAPSEVLRNLVQAKQGTDLQTSTFTQMLAYEVAREGYLDQHIEIIRKTYRERRDIMLAAMRDYLPQGVRWKRPQGGMFMWCVLPEGMSALKLLEACVEKKVAFVPGSNFYPCGGGENTMRLNFSNATPEVIREGISRLGAAIREMMAE
jgi:2-aminoadipate transaminase